jgi:hypothetical protein
MSLTQLLGWLGTLLILLAYFLVSFKKIDVNSRNFQLMNLIGALTLGVHVYYQKSWPALFLEIVWGGIALVSLLRKS